MRALRLLPPHARLCGRLLLLPKTLYPNLPSPRRRPRHWMCLSKVVLEDFPRLRPPGPFPPPWKVPLWSPLRRHRAPTSSNSKADEESPVFEELPADKQQQADEEPADNEEQPVDKGPSADEDSSSGEESSADEETPAKKVKVRKSKVKLPNGMSPPFRKLTCTQPTKVINVSAEVNNIVANSKFLVSLMNFHDKSPTIIQCFPRTLAEQASMTSVKNLKYFKFTRDIMLFL
ncbi:hypothetical protein IWX49DRAFT_551645 [Phyllosticta citricarpa]|uniref:Uncharacterized protein n=1 Tax=Phyllosticta citricarpa TaxID=55181 RepID=A0ABR1MGY0_9PEZI